MSGIGLNKSTLIGPETLVLGLEEVFFASSKANPFIGPTDAFTGENGRLHY